MLHDKMSKMKLAEEIGITHSLTQILTLGIYSGGDIFLLPLALAEITGWVLLVILIGFNFLGLPIIINILDRTFVKKTSILTIVKIIITGLTGGLLGFFLNIAYYKFHMFYIKKDFSISDYYNDFFPIVITLTGTIIIAEILRMTKLLKRQMSNKTEK